MAVLILAGPGYKTDTVFNLSKMQPYSLSDLLKPFRKLANDVALYLPRTSDMRQLADEADGHAKTTVIHYCMEGASKVCRLKSPYGRRINTIVGNLRILWGIQLSRRLGVVLSVVALLNSHRRAPRVYSQEGQSPKRAKQFCINVY